MSVFLQPIYTQTVGAGGAASITFNNIPQGFTDLVLYHSARDGRTDAPYSNSILTFNGNTNRVYSALSDSAVLTSVLPGQFVNEPWYFYNLYTAGQVATSNTFSNSSVYISRYNSGNFKQVLFESMVANNSSGVNGNLIVLNAGLFRSTSPITSMTITSVNGVFAQYSSWTLYGVSERFDTARPAAPTIGTPVDLGGLISIPFTANDTGSGQTADSYSVTTSPSTSTFYSNVSPTIITSPTLETAYTATVSANNAIGSNASSASSSITTYNNFASIATTTLSGNASSVTFYNIPQYYKTLQLRMMVRGSAATVADLGFYSVNQQATGNSRYGQGQTSNALTAGAYVGSGQPLSFTGAGANASASQFSPVIIEIADYANFSTWKQGKLLYGVNSNGSWAVGLSLHQYTIGTFPVNTITIYAWSLANFVANSTFTLYGIS